MDSPTSQSVAGYLSNHMGFQSWLAQHANQDVASLHNDPELSKFREEYNQNLNLGKLRTDPAQNTNIDINTFMQGVGMVSQMNKQAQMINRHMDHAAYPESLKTKSDQQLRFIMKDAYEAMKANPENPNNGYYQDEINYCANELQRRQRGVKAQQITNIHGFEIHPQKYQGGGVGYTVFSPPYGPTNSFGPVGFEKEEYAINWLNRYINEHPNDPKVLEVKTSEHEKANTPPSEPQYSGGDLSDPERDHGTSAQYAGKKQAQQTSNLDQLVSDVNQSLIVAQNSLVDLVDLLKQGFVGGGGEPVETNIPSSEEQGPSGRLEHLSSVAQQVLPQIEEAAQTFRSEMKYFSSFSNLPHKPMEELVASKKASIITKYTTGIKSLQEAHAKVDKVYQFANDFPYFVLNYDGFKALCNFRTACSNLKKDIENLQKI